MIAVLPLNPARKYHLCFFIKECHMLGTLFKFYNCKFSKVYLKLDGDRFTWENVGMVSNSGGGITCFYT